MMKRIKEFLKDLLFWVLAAAVVVGMFTPVVYWFINPELSKMQVFLDLWWVIIGTIACAIGASVILHSDK